MGKKARVIAYYLPQFHPIPENDKWWGKGFTEWRNVASAKPLFKGHYQPHIPADLGFYDLRISDVREQQAELARKAGIEGFCYWHYWFGHGKQLLEKPFQEVLITKKPDFPFCIGWANHDWTNKTWEVSTRKVMESTLMKQEYSNEDYIEHFNYLLPAFKDERYIRVDDKKCDAFKKACLLIEIFSEGSTKVCFYDKSSARYEALSGILFKATEYTVNELKSICKAENVVCK